MPFSVISSLIDNVGNNARTSSTNATNLQIAQMNNEYNRQMFDDQIKYNWEMFDAENDWNSAKSQVQRYKDAGMNPYMMMKNGNAGVAQGSSSPSAVPASDVGRAVAPPPNNVASSVSEFLNRMLATKANEADVRKTNAEAENMEINNDYQRELMERTIHGLGLDNESKEYRNNYLPSQLGYENRKLRAEAMQSEIGIDMAEVQLESAEIARDVAKINAKFAEETAVINFGIVRQTLKKLIADTSISWKTVKLLEEQALKTQAEKSGVEINNRILERSEDFLVNKNEYESIRARNNQGSDNEWQFWHHFNDDYQDKGLFDAGMKMLESVPQSIQDLFGRKLKRSVNPKHPKSKQVKFSNGNTIQYDY